VSCRQHAAKSCIRCEAPLCSEHEPARNQRCGDCEAIFATRRDQIDAFKWQPSLQREAFVLFASVILKLGMMAILMGLLLWTLGEIRDTAAVMSATGLWTVVFLAIRRVADGPSKRAMRWRARRSFLRQRRRPTLGPGPRPTSGLHPAPSNSSSF
jgi:hypothetical protein